MSFVPTVNPDDRESAMQTITKHYIDGTFVEIFGPVLSVIAYDSEDEAIRIANDFEFGLHAAVLGTDFQRARRLASQIPAGRVVINNMTDDPQAPWGGFKYSGIGREYGRYGIEAFLEPRAILE
jgi:aldehyde dehydrogenase (NAD+)